MKPNEAINDQVSKGLFNFHQLSVLAELLQAPGLKLAKELLVQTEQLINLAHALQLQSKTDICHSREIVGSYCQLGKLLLESQLSKDNEPCLPDLWQDYVLDCLLKLDNKFTRYIEETPMEKINSVMLYWFEMDLQSLQQLFLFNAHWWQHLCKEFTGSMLPLWHFSEQDKSLNMTAFHGKTMSNMIKKRLALSKCWQQEIPSLVQYYHQNGVGVFGEYHVFQWGDKGLIGIKSPDPIQMDDLVHYQSQRETVLQNTKRLLAGLPANNILLYGDRGTGKSSTVKAMVNEPGHENLRLIEVPKQFLGKFSEIVGQLKDRRQKFILFVDDLSFEEHESGYKELKAVLEGGVAPKPPNVAIYATSNRRHLIKENFEDRQFATTESGEIRPGDTYQEKLSLADRFGLSVTFTAPDQKTYLEIVASIASQEGLKMDSEILTQESLVWERTHNGRSGRTARQFIDSLIQHRHDKF